MGSSTTVSNCVVQGTELVLQYMTTTDVVTTDPYCMMSYYVLPQRGAASTLLPD